MSKTPPTISYVIITCNAPLKVIEQIRLIQEQEKETWHCVILDNGSMDDTGFQSRKLVDVDSRIRYVFQQKQSIEIAKQNALAVCLSKEIRFVEIG